MLNAVITWSLHHRFVVIVGALAFAALGLWSVAQLPIDAFPDTTPVQVQSNTVAPALGPAEAVVMRRLFWLAMGITIGALLVRKLSHVARSLTPSGMAQGLGASLADLADAVRDFAADVREAMAEREAELREGVAMDGRLGKAPSDGMAR